MELTIEQLNEQLDTTNMLLRRMRDQLDSAGIATVPAYVKRATFKEHLTFFVMLIFSIALIVVGLCVPASTIRILLCVVGIGALFYSLFYYIRKIDMPDLLADYNEYTKRAENLQEQIKTYSN